MDDSRAFVERGRCCFELHVRGFNHGAAGLLEFTLVDTVLSNLFYKGMNRCGRRSRTRLRISVFENSRCAAECAARFEPMCANVGFFATSTKCFRAG